MELQITKNIESTKMLGGTFAGRTFLYEISVQQGGNMHKVQCDSPMKEISERYFVNSVHSFTNCFHIIMREIPKSAIHPLFQIH